MKDLLGTIIVFLLGIVLIVCMIKGIEIGNFHIASIGEIRNSGTQLDIKIEEINKLKNATYISKTDELNKKIDDLINTKQRYLELASISTENDILKANLDNIYSMEFLWNKVGRYATKQNLNLTWNIVSTGVLNRYNLNFKVTGGYVQIINYIYALENDSDLSFKIENFSMTGTSESVTASFLVSNIGIKEETISNANYEETNQVKDEGNQEKSEKTKEIKNEDTQEKNKDTSNQKEGAK